MRRRTYESEADLALLQAFNATSIAATGGCGYVHPGDIPHISGADWGGRW